VGLLKRLSIPRSALLVPFGEIDPLAANVQLADVRRPGFFAQAPYGEPITAAGGGVRDRGRPVMSLVIPIGADRSRRPPSRTPGIRSTSTAPPPAPLREHERSDHGQPIHLGILDPAKLRDIAVEHLLGAR
jgi:hypothetical protein